MRTQLARWGTVLVSVGLFAVPVGQVDAGSTLDVEMKVERAGGLAVTETITAPPGLELSRVTSLVEPAGDGRERRYRVRGAVVAGSGSVEVADDELRVVVRGNATVSYTVDGAVAGLPGRQEVRWRVADGWNTGLSSVRASFVAPVQRASPITCLAGTPGSGRHCGLAEVDHTGVVRAEQAPLAAGERMVLAVGLPSATVTTTAEFVPTGRTWPWLLALALGGLLAFALVAGGLVVLLARRRDARAFGVAEPVEVLLRDGDRVRFSSPDGVLPGQIGTVMDGVVDVVDISATVLDLVVRRYLDVRSDDADGWEIVLLNAADADLHDYERTLLATLLPDPARALSLSRSHGRDLDLTPVIDAMYDDAVRQGWFSRRPDRGRGLLPPRTARGRLLAGQVRGLLDHLNSLRPAGLPLADRELVFTRSLPYALVLGCVEHWIAAFAEDERLAGQGRDLSAFLVDLSGVLVESEHLTGRQKRRSARSR